MATATAEIVQYNPENVSQLEQFCKYIVNSGLLPAHLRGKPADLMVTVMTGRELGLTPMQAIRGMFVIGGKASMYADQMVGLCASKPACKYFRLVESTPARAVYETLRDGHPEPTRLAYTMEEAEKAGLTSNPNYKKHPAAMLRARASAALARAVYPDLVAGVYDPSEIEKEEPVRAEKRVVRGTAEEAPTPVAANATVEAEVVQEPPHDPQTGEVTPPAEEPHPAAVETPAAVEARLIAACKVGWKNWDDKRAWSKEHKAEKDALPADAQERVTAAFIAGHPQNKPTTTKPAPAAA